MADRPRARRSALDGRPNLTARSFASAGVARTAAGLSALRIRTAPVSSSISTSRSSRSSRRKGIALMACAINANAGLGFEHVYVCIDDASRLAFLEVREREDRFEAAAFLRSAVRWFHARGIRIERVMTDNGKVFLSRDFQDGLKLIGARHHRSQCTHRESTAKPNDSFERGSTSAPMASLSRARENDGLSYSLGTASTMRRDLTRRSTTARRHLDSTRCQRPLEP